MNIADDEIQLAKRVEELIERGLGRYGNGDMEGALAEWKHALALDPDSERAASYLSYVEDHLDLSDSTRELLTESTVELAYPFGLTELGLTQLGGGGLEEYESIEIVNTDSAGPGDGDITKPVLNQAPSEDIGDGWSVDEAWAEDLVNKGRSSAPGAERIPLQPRPDSEEETAETRAPLVENDFADLDLALAGEDDQEPTQARGGSAPGLVDAEIELLSLASHDGDEPPTIALPTHDGEDAPTAALPTHNGDDAPTIARRSPSHGFRDDSVETGTTGVGAESAEDHTVPGGVAGRHSDALGADAIAALRKHTAPDFATLGAESTTAERSGAATHGFDELEFENLESAALKPEISDAIDDEAHPAVSLRLDDDVPAENAMDEELTIDRGSLGALGLVAGIASREESGLLSLAVDDVDRSSHAVQDPTRETSILPPAISSDEVLASVIAGAPSGDDGARTLYIVGRLIEIAEHEFIESNYAAAASAVSCALERADDSAVAQKVIFEKERCILQVLIASLGELTDIPELLIPLTEIPLDQLDHRAAFLLTRMDGNLTLDEILDVSGMPRMEALRHLSRMHAKGFLQVG